MSQKEIWRIRKLVQRMVKITEDSRCEICGKRHNLHRHHSDGSILNNDRNNIVVICLRCHINIHLVMGTWNHDLGYIAVD